MRNIPVVREADWALDHKRGPAMKEARGIHQERDYELDIRGEALPALAIKYMLLDLTSHGFWTREARRMS